VPTGLNSGSEAPTLSTVSGRAPAARRNPWGFC